MKTLRTAITEYTIRDDGIVIGRDINPETERTTQLVSDSFDRVRELTQGRRAPGLWDARSIPNFPLSVWTVFVDRIDKVVVALAILVGESGERAMGAFSEVLSSLLIPVRLFDDEAAAIEWLQQFLDQEDDPQR
ncbi:MAG: hypothetical protein QNJ81_10765 [Acidimicrobiia bacterium]|nr:hypothetical protein [Acidimicrobiia bacterium]